MKILYYKEEQVARIESEPPALTSEMTLKGIL